MTYYRGDIINVRTLPNYNYHISIAKLNTNYNESYHLLGNTDHNALLYFKGYSSGGLKKLVTLIKNIISCEATDEQKSDLDKTIKSIFKPNPKYVSGESIIYEKSYDQNGQAYGKEIITGEIFPIKTNYSDFDVYYSLKIDDEIYYDLEYNKGYYLKREEKGSCYVYYLIDLEQNKHEISSDEFTSLWYLRETQQKTVRFDSENHEMTKCESPMIFNVCLSPKMEFPSNQRVEYAIGEETLANELEFNGYIDRLYHHFGNRRRQRIHKNMIVKYSQSNNLGEITFSEKKSVPEERVSESALTKEMQDLEYLLLKLKNISKEDYDLLNKEYIEILNQDDNGLHVNTLSLSSIISLQNRVQLAFMCRGGNSKNIIGYLEEQVGNYLDNYNNGSIVKTEISITDLDRLSKYFLSSKNGYSIKEQNEILRCLALIYFFEMYENRDILNSDDLENSYIKDNIKRILVVIDILHDEGIIKTVPNNLYEIDSVDELLEYIQKIEFNDILEGTGEKLVKKIQQ